MIGRGIPTFFNDPSDVLKGHVTGQPSLFDVTLADVAEKFLAGEDDLKCLMIDITAGSIQESDITLSNIMSAIDGEITAPATNTFDVSRCEIFGVPADSAKSVQFDTLYRGVSQNVTASGLVGVSDLNDFKQPKMTLKSLLTKLENSGLVKNILVLQEPGTGPLAAVAPEACVIASTEELASTEGLLYFMTNHPSVLDNGTGKQAFVPRSLTVPVGAGGPFE